MNLNKLLKKIREENEMSQEAMGKRLGVSKSLITQMEGETKNISDKTITKLYDLFPLYKKKIDEALLQDKVGKVKELSENISENTLSKFIKEVKIKGEEVKIPVYNFIIKSDGLIDKNKFEMEEFLLPTKLKNYKNIFALKINGENEKHNLEDNQVLIIRPSNTKWEELDGKLVVIQYNEEMFAKLVKFEDYKPFLYNLNTTYPPIEIDKDISLIGTVAFSIIEF